LRGSSEGYSIPLVGEDRERHQSGRRVTVDEAARHLGLTVDAIRKRVQREQIPFEKDGAGRVRIILDDSETLQDESPDTTGQITAEDYRGELVEELRDRVRYLEKLLDGEREARTEERRRQDTVIAQLSASNAEQARTIRELEAPQEASDASEMVEEAPERAEPRSAAGGAQEVAESTQPQSGWLTPVDRLPWWTYVLGLLVMFVARFSFDFISVLYLVPMSGELPYWAYALIAIGLLLWLFPGLLGLWIGLKRRRAGGWVRSLPQAILRGIAAAIVILLGSESGWIAPAAFFEAYEPPPSRLEDVVVSTLFILAGTLLYVSGEIIGDAWQRRRAEKAQGEALTRSASENTLSPRSQAMLGFAGTIISAILGLTGTVITTLWGGG
jgi:excisionase family DNA binding protein